MQQTIQLNTEILSKAAAAEGYSLVDFARYLYKKEQTVNNITKGLLTFGQAKKFAEKSKIPFGYLFLKEPPKEYELDTAFIDFRTRTNNDPLSKGFMKTLRDVEHKQNWYRNYLISKGADKLPFVGMYSNRGDATNTEIATEIRKTLKIETITAKQVDKYFSALSKACEAIGILVFKNSIVINNTHSKLNPEEFDGFVITDDYAPCIFINGAASRNANIFTLAHELAHIWLGESGVSNSKVYSKNNNEARCDAIAAQVLVPQQTFIELWDQVDGQPLEKVRLLNRHFKVSELVIARTALTLKKIDYTLYQEVEKQTNEAWEKYKKKLDAGEGGPKPITTVSLRNSQTITNTVIGLLKSDKMVPRQAAILLNKPAATVGNL